MAKVGSDVEAHLFPVAALDNPPQGGFAQYILRHGARILETGFRMLQRFAAAMGGELQIVAHAGVTYS